MSYRMRISSRARHVGRFIAKVHKEIQNIFSSSGLSQQELATRLDVDRSTINKRLLGEANLTLRSIGELAWAMHKEVSISFKDRNDPGRNYHTVETYSEGVEEVRNRGPKTKSPTAYPLRQPRVLEEVA